MAREMDGEVLFFGVAWRATEAECREYMEDFDVPYEAGLDHDEVVFDDYRVPYQPATVLVTDDGRIFEHIPGGVDRDFLTGRIRAMLEA